MRLTLLLTLAFASLAFCSEELQRRLDIVAAATRDTHGLTEAIDMLYTKLERTNERLKSCQSVPAPAAPRQTFAQRMLGHAPVQGTPLPTQKANALLTHYERQRRHLKRVIDVCMAAAIATDPVSERILRLMAGRNL